MKLSDGNEMPLVDDKANTLQPTGEGVNWQDSVVLLWMDMEQKVGGMFRLGHEPNCDGGKIAVWSHITCPRGTYHYADFIPLREEDRPASGGIGGGPSIAYEFLDGEHVWTLTGEVVQGRLMHSDFHDQCEGYPKSSSVAQEFANVHLDIPGQTQGQLTIDGHEYEVKALSFRDKGWGVRDWNSLLSHRWVAGTFGSHFSFLFLSYHSNRDDLASFGWVVRDNVLTYAKTVEIITYTEIDGVSNRGGEVRFELTTGEQFELQCSKAVEDTFISYHHDIACADTLCEARCGDMVGFADFESTNNLQAGKRRPAKFHSAIVDSGWYPASR